MIIKNAKIFIEKEKQFFKKDIRVNDEYIEEIKYEIKANTSELILDLNGRYITPGLIDAHSHIGIKEESIGAAGIDHNEKNKPIYPSLRVIDGINSQDMAFEKALKGGVTCVLCCPGSINTIAGQCSIIKTNGNTVDSMLRPGYKFIKCSLGENAKKYGELLTNYPTTRMGIAAIFRNALHQTFDYKIRKNLSINEPLKMPQYDPELEALIPVINKEALLKIHCHRVDDIMTAIRISKEFNINITLDHCTDGYLVKKEIKKSGISVILGPILTFGDKSEEKNINIKNIKELYEEGVNIALATDHPVMPQYSLILAAIIACRSGVPEGEAIKMITSNPARVLGIYDRVGSLEEGKYADIVVWSKHPFHSFSQVEKVMIQGNVVYSI